MKQETQKNMYEVRKLRDEIDEIIKLAFNSWQSVEIVKCKLINLLSSGTMWSNEDETLFI